MATFPVVPDILEVTLRDGSYLIDFQFTAEDTANIASALENVGFRWIEVGHGLGPERLTSRERARLPPATKNTWKPLHRR